MLQALIFDVDGTLADTESVHRAAFNASFAEAGLDWHWSEALYTDLLDVAGGKERLLAYWQALDPAAARAPHARAWIDHLHAIKTRHYAALMAAGGPPLRPGVLRLLDEARAAGSQLAIATTTTPANIAALLAPALGAGWRAIFASVCDGAKVGNKKPAPDVYHCVLRELRLPAADCIAFEDSANGLRAATAAGIATVVTPTAFTRGQHFDGALRVLHDLADTDLAALRRWHHRIAESNTESNTNPERRPPCPSPYTAPP